MNENLQIKIPTINFWLAFLESFDLIFYLDL